jgi:hypothetical protein
MSLSNGLLLAAALAAVLLNVFRRRARQAKAVPSGTADEQTLAALAEAGGDLTKETEVLFFLYFPSEAHARSAAQVVGREGFATEVGPPVDGTSWSCTLTRQMVPSPNEIARTRSRLEELATSLHGEFDGWEAAVTS